MAITINISEGGSALPSTSSSATEGLSLDAGASVALTPNGADGQPAHAHARDAALDGGSPPPSLVHDVEAALLAVGSTTRDASLSAHDVSGGAAPA